MSRRTWRVLIVDDSAEDRAQIRRLLLQGSEDQLIFTEAALGREAITAAWQASAPPDCMILDYFLPDMEAPAVLAALRDTNGLTVCPVIVLTGAANSTLGHDVLRAGAQDFIGKDWFTFSGLVRTMENASQRWQMACEIESGARALAQRELELRTLTDNTPAVLTRFDAAFRYLYANAAITRTTGHSPDYFVGRTLQELGMPAAVYVPWQLALERVFATGRADQLELSEEINGVRSDQATRFVPEFGVAGEVVSVLTITHDITDLRQVEVAQRESAERLRMALSAGHAGAWSWEISSGVVVWSPENFLLYGRDPLSGQPSVAQWLTCFHTEDLSAAMQRMEEIAAGRLLELRAECRIMHPELGVRWLLWMGKLEMDITGTPYRIVGINLDITDRKRLEHASRREDQRKDEFLAILSHELRNPLAALSTGLQVLKAATSSGISVRPVQEMMERQFRHMIRLVDDLLDVSRIGNGKIELKRECILMQTVLDHAIEANESFMMAAGHRLVLAVDTPPVWVNGDLTRLAQIVGNLLHNAIKYTPHVGQIDLSMHIDGPDVMVSVADNGIGIPPDMVTHVFDLFTQVEHTLQRAQGGLGIGLGVVAELVALHGGSVTCLSRGLGMGSVFTVRLPITNAPASSIMSSSLGLQVPLLVPTDRPRRVLIVDDNTDAAEVMAMMLKIHECNTITASNGMDALAASLSFLPDMILLDIGLPDIDGYEVARRLRADPSTAKVILVALTGWGSASDKLRSSAAGFDGHLTKPVDMDTIMSLLQIPRDLTVGYSQDRT
jgi:PAS domain S-box-containing protein